MIKKVLLPLSLLIALIIPSFVANAQCGLVVDIDPIPRAHICLGESVDLLVKTNLSTPIPMFCALNADRTCGIGSDSITSSIGAGAVVNGFNSSAPEIFGDFGEAQSKSQIIVQASELSATGFNGGKLNSIALDIARLEVGKNHTIQNFSIKIGCTGNSNFTNAFLSGLDEVFAPRTITLTTTGILNFEFDQAFDWDGVSNIVIEFCYYTPAGTSASTANMGNFTKDHVPGFAAWRHVTSPSSSGSCSLTGTEKNFNQRPNIRFNICRPKLVNLSYSWTPVNGTLSSPTSGRPTATPIVDTRYVVTVTKIDEPTCTAKDSVDIVVEDPSLFTPTANTPTCVGSTLQFNANTTGVTYFWSGPNGFSDFSQNPSIPNVTVAATGTYVFQVDKGFCKATKSVNVVIEPIPVMGTAKDSTVCRSVTAVNLAGLLTGEDPGGVWIDDNASGILAGASINPSLLNNATLPATFQYTYRITNTCGTFTNLVKVTVIPTKSPGIPDDTIICETGPAINLFTVLDGTPATGGFWTDNSGSGQVTSGGIFTPSNLGGGIYMFDYTVLGTAPCPNTSARVTVTVADQPYAGIDGTKNLCVGASANLFSQLTGSPKTGGTWVDVNNSGGSLNAASGNYTASNVLPGNYQFRYIVGAVAPCLADTSFVVVTVFDSPKISNVTTTCAPDQLSYITQFQITGGQPSSYSVDPAGTITGTSPKFFTSNSIPDATSATFTVSDAQGCGTASITVLKRCECPTQSGSVATSPALQVCNNGFATVVNTGGYVSDGDDTLMYVLHTSPTTTLGTILIMQSSPVFSYDASLTYGVTYYVSAVAGSKLPNNLVDLTDQCLSVSVGVPIKFGQVGQPSFTFSTNPACPGIDVTLTSTVDGSPSYSWVGPNGLAKTTPNVTISPVSANSAGVYQLTVSSNGCSLSTSNTLQVVTTPVVTITAPASVCKGQSVELVFNLNAPAPITLTYTTVPGTTQQILLNPGSQSITVFPTSTTTYNLVYGQYQGSCGFSLTGSTTIQVVTPPVLSYAALGPTIFCYDESNTGVVQFQINPAVTVNLTYTVNGILQPTLPNVSTGNTFSFTPPYPGINTFKVVSANLPDGSCPLTLVDNPQAFYNLTEPIVTASVNQNIICDNDSVLLSFDVTASEQIAIRYQINSDEFVLSTNKDTAIYVKIPVNTSINVLEATYLLKSSCLRTINQSFFITAITAPKPNFEITHTACNNVSTGSIIVSTPDSQDLFSLNNSPYSTNGSFTQLTSGSYVVRVKNDNNCVATEQIEIIAASNLVVETPVIHTSCGKADGEVNIDVVSGVPPYTILLDGSTVDEGITGDLAAGNYAVLVIDGNNCVKQNFITINQSAPISISVVNSGLVDCTQPEYIETVITPSGGSGVFTYQMDATPPQTDSIYLGLYPQTHRVTVTDDRACTTTKIFTISSVQKFTISPQILQPLICWESHDAVIKITTQNGASSNVYSLDNINYQTNNLFTGVGPGNFLVYVRELTGCRREQSVSFGVTRPDSIDLVVNSFGEPSCFNSPNGFVQLKITGGSVIDKFFSADGGLTYQSNPTIAGLYKGNYVFLAKDENNCHSDTIYFTMGGPPDIIISGSFVFDAPQTKATLTIEASGGDPGYLYSLDGVDFVNNPVFPDLSPGTYTMYVMDIRNCVGSQSIVISGVGIGEISGAVVSIFPNPFSDRLNISTDRELTNVNLSVVNAIGQIVYSVWVPRVGNRQVEILMPAAMVKGVYSVKLESDQGAIIRKLINE